MAARRVYWMLLVILAVAHEGTAENLVTMSRTNTSRVRREPVQGLLRRIPVAVFAPVDIKDSLVNRICAEAEAIWKPAHITFEWHRFSSVDTVRTWWLDVIIDGRLKDVRDQRAALGWIPFAADGPRPSIHLWRSNAEELLLRTQPPEDRTMFTHEELLGRALGRALSHELGHYLLRSREHTPHGLMRAERASEEFFRISRDGFELSAEERQIAALQVLHETTDREGVVNQEPAGSQQPGAARISCRSASLPQPDRRDLQPNRPAQLGVFQPAKTARVTELRSAIPQRSPPDANAILCQGPPGIPQSDTRLQFL